MRGIRDWLGTELHASDQIRHHIRSQHSESVVVSTENYHLEVVMRILRYLGKAPGRELLYSDQEHMRITCFSYAD